MFYFKFLVEKSQKISNVIIFRIGKLVFIV